MILFVICLKFYLKLIIFYLLSAFEFLLRAKIKISQK